jgi:exodeoxyribonuclease VII small subunit
MKKAAKLKAIEGLTFEAAFKELEECVAKLESGELPLEESLALYERGQALAAYCGKMLDQAELKIEELP